MINYFGQVPIVEFGVGGAVEFNHNGINILIIFCKALVSRNQTTMFILIDGIINFLFSRFKQCTLVQGSYECTHIFSRG